MFLLQKLSFAFFYEEYQSTLNAQDYETKAERTEVVSPCVWEVQLYLLVSVAGGAFSLILLCPRDQLVLSLELDLSPGSAGSVPGLNLVLVLVLEQYLFL